MAGIACIYKMAHNPKLIDKVLDELEVRFDICYYELGNVHCRV